MKEDAKTLENIANKLSEEKDYAQLLENVACIRHVYHKDVPYDVKCAISHIIVNMLSIDTLKEVVDREVVLRGLREIYETEDNTIRAIAKYSLEDALIQTCAWLEGCDLNKRAFIYIIKACGREGGGS